MANSSDGNAGRSISYWACGFVGRKDDEHRLLLGFVAGIYSLMEQQKDLDKNRPSKGDATLVILGERGDGHLGTHFQEAASALGISYHLIDSRKARGNRLLHRIWWRLFRVPPFSRRYSQWVSKECLRLRPALLLAMGRVPLRGFSLGALRQAGLVTANFASDDPWNPLYRTRWLLESTASYDWVFTPRTRNEEQLRELGVRNVAYMPFAYSPSLHERSLSAEFEIDDGRCDVLYVGGCDADRIPYLRAIQAAGFSMSIFGAYWERVSALRTSVRGIGGMRVIQDSVQTSKVTLVLPRHANRDGHVMRTFETAAAGGCMLVEETPEHRSIFGSESPCVVFFQGLDDMVVQLRKLVDDSALRTKLRRAVREHIVHGGRNRYQDRLESIWSQAVSRVL